MNFWSIVGRVMRYFVMMEMQFGLFFFFPGRSKNVHMFGLDESPSLYSTSSETAVMCYRFKNWIHNCVLACSTACMVFLSSIQRASLCLRASNPEENCRTLFMFVCSPHCVEEIASCSESCCFY